MGWRKLLTAIGYLDDSALFSSIRCTLHNYVSFSFLELHVAIYNLLSVYLCALNMHIFLFIHIDSQSTSFISTIGVVTLCCVYVHCMCRSNIHTPHTYN